MERQEVREKVALALKGLPEIYREIFVLRDVEQLSAHDCAEIAGISEQLVKVRLHRARLMMRERLAPIFKKPWLDRILPGKGRKPW
jgi:RNA polymerase sigma-70 factor (ECF subfamily)